MISLFHDNLDYRILEFAQRGHANEMPFDFLESPIWKVSK